MVCGVSFEELPAWLWVMRPVEWAVILITEHDDLRLRRNQSELYSRISDRIQVMRTHVGNHTLAMEARVWWISGTVEFVNSLAVPPRVPKVAWLTKAPRRPPRELSKEDQWMTLAHSKVGGTTTSRGTFLLSNMDRISIQSDLTRNIGHIVKFSIRSKSCPASLSEPHYTLNSKLNVHRLHLPILLPSDFSGTGWGQRQLEPPEIAAAFDLPDFVPWDPRFSDLLVPLQLLRVIMDEVIQALIPSHNTREGARPRLVQGKEDRIPIVDGVWLPEIQRWLPGSWADIKIADKAVKDDEAQVNTHPWYQRVSLVLPCPPHALKIISMLLMRRWRRNIVHSFFFYLAREYGPTWVHRLRSSHKRKRISPEASGIDGGEGEKVEYPRFEIGTREGYRVRQKFDPSDHIDQRDSELVKDLIAGLPILGQVLQSTWWEWSSGSSLFFWRWNGMEQIRASRDGIVNFVQGRLPKRRAMKPLRLSEPDAKLVLNKITGMIQRTYLSSGFVKSSLHFFAVPKGDSDVRIVYDGTSCGLNEALWAPNFYLPSSKAAALMLSFGSWMADSDFGEMFHNFPMETRIRQHAGVELRSLKGHEASKPVRWSRLFMGMRSSPYNSVRHYYWGEEFARGNPKKVNNPMGYSRIRLNLPGLSTYDPLLPKVMKWQDSNSNDAAGYIAGDVITFVDDVRIVGSSKEYCRAVHRQFVSRMQYLGLQDAPRKFRPPSQTSAGAWTGTIFRITRNTITKSVSAEKWEKGKRILTALSDACEREESGRPSLDRKQLERDTGFLNHLSMTFDEMVPFLKGCYLTLNSWRPQRDDQDWKVTSRAWSRMIAAQVEGGAISGEDIQGHAESGNAPSVIVASPRFKDDVRALNAILGENGPPVVQLRAKTIVSVVYGFGDASGSGLGATFTCGKGFTFRIGVWGTNEMDESSNWKEFSNVVESLEDEAASGNLANSEIFMFTDNATVESCSHKGSSSSPKLLELIIRLKSMVTRNGLRLHIFHVAGTRMIAQGTDGVSRGFLAQGIMAGEPMSSFIPIHETAIKRSAQLERWIRSWAGENAVTLSEEGWYQEGHDIESSLGNSEDVPSCSLWVGNCVKCLKERKWTEGIFCGNFGRNVMGYGTCRRMWCGACYTSHKTPEFHVANVNDNNGEVDDGDRIKSGWQVRKNGGTRFNAARDGDDLMVSFECDTCIFSKLFRRLPFEGTDTSRDEFVMGCIRRVILDSFWSRARSTVSGNTYLMRSTMKMTVEMLGHKEGPYTDPGPLPSVDHCGYMVAVQMVASSLGQGRYSPSYKQWDTIRRVKSVFSNQFRASAKANATTLSMASNKGTGAQMLSEDPCSSLWFLRFSEGCRKRMGQEWRPNRAISVELMLLLLAAVEQRVMDADDNAERVKWILAGGYFCICYVVSLRSTEGLLCDLDALREHFKDDRDYVIIPLLGQVKGEHHSRQHLLPCVMETDSGIPVKVWLKRLITIHEIGGRLTGPVFINGDGVQASTAEMNDLFQELMTEAFETRRDLFEVDIKTVSDIQEKYNVYRSFRRGSESRAVAQRVSEADRYVIHRWRKKEAAGASKPSHPIDQMYVDISLVKAAFLRYTKAM